MRDSEGWCCAIGIKKVPDHTLCRAAKLSFAVANRADAVASSADAVANRLRAIASCHAKSQVPCVK